MFTYKGEKYINKHKAFLKTTTSVHLPFTICWIEILSFPIKTLWPLSSSTDAFSLLFRATPKTPLAQGLWESLPGTNEIWGQFMAVNEDGWADLLVHCYQVSRWPLPCWSPSLWSGCKAILGCKLTVFQKLGDFIVLRCCRSSHKKLIIIDFKRQKLLDLATRCDIFHYFFFFC